MKGSNLFVNYLLLDEKKSEETKRADWRRDARDENWTCKCSLITSSSESVKALTFEYILSKKQEKAFFELIDFKSSIINCMNISHSII